MRAALLLACFALSGCAGLIYQTAWLRELVTVYGNTVDASAALLATFMGGLAAGAALGGRFLWARPATGLRAYGVLELAIAATGGASQALLPAHEWLMAEWIGFVPMGYAALLLKGLAVLPFMLPPTLAMGATLPLFVRAWVSSMDDAGARLATAYGVNTLGAMGGALSAAFVWIPRLGLGATIGIAAALNTAVGIAALCLSAAPREVRGGAAPELPAAAAAPGRGSRRAATIYFLTGFAAIGAEVLWTRILSLHMGSSVYAYGAMLALVLTGIGLGSLAVARFADRAGFRTWLACLLALGASLVLQLHAVTALPELAGALGEALHPRSFGGSLSVLALSGLVPLVVPTLLMGVAFPLGIRVLSATPAGLARRTGSLYAANGAGGIAGAIATSTLLLGSLGANGTAWFLALLECASALLVATWLPAGLPRRAVQAAAASLPFLLAASLPRDSVLLRVGTQRIARDLELVAFHEGATSLVTVRASRDGATRVIETNLVNVAGTSGPLVSTQKLQAHVPLLLHPGPRRVLHIGFGSGGTAWSVSRHPVERIDIVEISPDVVRMADAHFRDVNHGVVEDPRVRFLWGDGRNYLLATGERYDVILSDSIHPAVAGNGNLYTLEYFRHAARHLEPGGVFSTWLPMYWLTPDNFQEILKSFSLAFEETAVWYPHNTVARWVIVTGRRGPLAEPGGNAIERRFAEPAVRADLAEIGYRHALDLLDNFLMGPEALQLVLRDVPPHRDDRLQVEYESGRERSVNQTWFANFRWLAGRRTPLARILPREHAWPEALVERHRRAADAVIEGQLALMACRVGDAAAHFQAGLAALPDHREPWLYVRNPDFASYRPDWCRKG